MCIVNYNESITNERLNLWKKTKRNYIHKFNVYSVEDSEEWKELAKKTTVIKIYGLEFLMTLFLLMEKINGFFLSVSFHEQHIVNENLFVCVLVRVFVCGCCFLFNCFVVYG